MRKIYALFILLFGVFMAGSVSAQHPTCDGIRYSNVVFPMYDSTMSVQFGSNTTFSGNQQDLFMDVFEPAGDLATDRPAIVLGFGGAFLVGQRSDVHSFCRSFARLGYVAVAIDYRLFDNLLFTDTSQAIDAVVKATHDMKAAIRFLREDAATADQFRIDPNLIYAGGVSAGAVTACHVAYLDTSNTIPQSIMTILNNNGGVEGTSNNINQPSNVQGVINYSGALKDADWIDAGEPPMYSAHDDGDGTVPYGSATIFIPAVQVHLEGSSTMKTRCDAVGVSNTLYTVANSGGHVSYFQNAAGTALVFAQTTTFLYETTCPGIVALEELATQGIKAYPNPAQDQLMLEVAPQWSSYSYQMWDATGRQILYVDYAEGMNQTISVIQFPRGLYILKIQDLSGSNGSFEKKILLN